MLGIITHLKLEINHNLNFFLNFFSKVASLVQLNSRVSFQKFFDVFEFARYSVNFEIFYGMFIIINHHNKNLEDYTSARKR